MHTNTVRNYPMYDTNVIRKEIEAFRQAHPSVEEVDLYTAGITPKLWGKRYPIAKLAKLIGQLKMPRGNYLMSPIGQYLEVLEYNWKDGDPDTEYHFVPGSLKLAKWGDEPRAQIMVTTASTDTPFVGEPRTVLQQVVNQFKDRGWHPTVAYELEFYLFDPKRDDHGMVQLARNPFHGRREEQATLDMESLEFYGDVLSDIRRQLNEQGIVSTAMSAEMGAGQFEINLNHHSDVVAAADETIDYQRLIRGVARQHGFEASFMAKPFLKGAGSGMHFHISIYDEKGHNLLAANDHEQLRHAVGGGMANIPSAMCFMAANPNAYRRYALEGIVATESSWAYENRSVAIRIPDSDEKNLRLEYRLAAADANPYLAMAAALSSILMGLDQKLDPGEPFEGYACDEHGFPRTLRETLDLFEANAELRRYMGEAFSEMYLAYKRSELLEFERFITAREYEWYV